VKHHLGTASSCSRTCFKGLHLPSGDSDYPLNDHECSNRNAKNGRKQHKKNLPQRPIPYLPGSAQQHNGNQTHCQGNSTENHVPFNGILKLFSPEVNGKSASSGKYNKNQG